MSVPSHPKLDGFDIFQTAYKQVGNHSIRTDILVPQAFSAKARPVIIRFHGGALMLGESLYMDYWPYWLSDLALQYGAIIISANYRLLPEVTTPEIYEDVEDLWTWVHSPALKGLLAMHAPQSEIDLDRILTAGESAGGLLSISLALAHPNEIRAATAAYPWIDPCAAEFSTPRTRAPMGMHTPEQAYNDGMASITLGNPESSIMSTDRIGLMLAAIEYGHLGGLYQRGTHGAQGRKAWYPMERLEESDIRIPRGGIAMFHGRQDSVVPLYCTERFVARAREVTAGRPGNNGLVLAVRDADHGFDGDVRLDEEWLSDTLKIAVEAWLQ